MNDDKKKTEELKDAQLQNETQLSEEELDQVAGGWDDKSAADENYALAGA